MATSPLSRTFLVVALISGTVIAGAVLLWVFDVIPTAAFLGVVVVMFALESLVILFAVRRTAQGANRRPGSAGPTSGPAVTEVHGASTLPEPGAGEGYDPMERYRAPRD
jgi:hypothetical protein